MKRIVLMMFMVVAGCATQATPEMRKLADERRGQQHKIEVALLPEDNVARKCGHLKYYEQYECSQKLLRWKLEKQAEDYCVFYAPFEIKWEITRAASFNRATRASTTVTCTGIPQRSGA